MGFSLVLADGQRWVIRAADEEADECTRRLGQVMQLGRGGQGREMLVAVCRSSPNHFDAIGNDGPLLCCLPRRLNGVLGVLQMEQVARRIAQASLKRGGLLIHGALAAYRGGGFIMAGPGGIGKSTVSRRLPSSWRSLCDDKTLVVRDGNGRFWAHPWPTWSLFNDGGPGGSWAVEQAVRLRAIFFLDRSPSGQLAPLNATEATALTIESAMDLAWEASRLDDENDVRALLGEGVRAARDLASAVPAYTLKLGLDGRFWEQVERVLPVGASGEVKVEVKVESGVSSSTCVFASTFPAASAFRMVYTGSSMNPTFDEPDLLEVTPYTTGRVRPGDVVCFKQPETGTTVVHRVVSVGRRSSVAGQPIDGIRTRGDNSVSDDPWVLQTGDIIGRVKAAQRGTRRRVVIGGWRGPMVPHCARLGQGIQRSAGLLPHKLYGLVAGLGPFDRLLPVSLRPRLVRFDIPYRVFLKLLMGKQTVGYYDDRIEKWRIRRPFRLFVDEQTLRAAGSLVSRSEERKWKRQ